MNVLIARATCSLASPSPPPSEASGSQPASRPHYRELDGLRGLSILLVLAGHLFQFVRPSGDWANATAGLGVMVFFGLSGFLITDLLCREASSRRGRIDLKAFYIRRALRLLPALAVFLGAVELGVLAGWIDDVPWKSMGAALLYVRNIFGRGETTAHLWSLSLEEQFYLLWPLAMAVVPRRWILPLSLAAALGIGFVRAVLITGEWFDYRTGVFYLRPWFRFDSLLVGCIAALLRSRPESRAQRILRLFARIPPAASLFMLVAWSVLAEHSVFRPMFFTVQGVLAAGLVTGLVIGRDGVERRVFRQRWLSVIGQLSYSLYLWQQPFLVTRSPDWGPLRQLPGCLIATFACAVISYALVERPFLRLKTRLTA